LPVIPAKAEGLFSTAKMVNPVPLLIKNVKPPVPAFAGMTGWLFEFFHRHK
jgi:hypothetical protein